MIPVIHSGIWPVSMIFSLIIIRKDPKVYSIAVSGAKIIMKYYDKKLIVCLADMSG